jgi:glutamate carboxypeptidase
MPKSAVAEAVRRYAGSLSSSGGAATSNALTTPQGQGAAWLFGLESIGADVEVAVTGGMNRPPYQKDAGIAQLFGKAQAIYRGKELLDVPLTGGGSDSNFTAALGIPTLDGQSADCKGAHAAYEQIYFSSLMQRTYLCTRPLETLE